MTRFRTIGPGRAGGSLERALLAAGWDAAPSLGRGDDLDRAGEGVALVVLAVPDAVVAEVAAAVTPRDEVVVAHLSGSLGLAPLAGHPRRAVVHPLVALPDAARGAARLPGAWFGLAVAGDPLAHEVVAALDGHSVLVAEADWPRYHAAAVIAANHLVALLGQVERVAGGVGAPLEAYLALAQGSLDDVAALGPAAALTGPVRRGDTATVARHVAALPEGERAAYLALSAEAAAVPVRTVATIAELRAELGAARQAGRSVGFVPTMGFLHEGHASLMRAARADADVVVTSIFVNPLQFGPQEDLDAYPRDLTGDTALAEREGVDLLFVPSTREMYPSPVLTTVSVREVSAPLDGRSRPGHFDGVATVVAKLFSIVGPCRSYFGEKDFQQLAVVRHMALDLSLPVEVIGCPTVRESDGLAMSSRNAYLTTEERTAAPVVHRALQAGLAALADGARDPAAVRAAMAALLEAEPLAQLDYAEVVDAATLAVPDPLDGTLRLLVAARFGGARLIDNVGATVGATAEAASTEGSNS